MNIPVNVEKNHCCHGPVYEEPYHGFFEENGFASQSLGLCQWEDYIINKINIGPFFGDEGYGFSFNHSKGIYYGCKDIELNFGNHRMNVDAVRKVKCYSLFDLEEREKKGEPVSKLIQPFLQKIKSYGGQVWYGYQVVLPVCEGRIVCLEEDFVSSKGKIDSLVSSLTERAVSSVSKLDHKKLTELYTKLDKNGASFDRCLGKRMRELSRQGVDLDSLAFSEKKEKLDELLGKPLLEKLNQTLDLIKESGVKDYEDSLISYFDNNCQELGLINHSLERDPKMMLLLNIEEVLR